MTDIDRYLTADAAEAAADEARRVRDELQWDDSPDLMAMQAALASILPSIIAKSKAEALRDAADALADYDHRNHPPADSRWTSDLGFYGEAAWLRDRADRIEAEGVES